MGEVSCKPVKPLQINPIRLTQPMGATLAFLGVDRCMPLMHGAGGSERVVDLAPGASAREGRAGRQQPFERGAVRGVAC